MGCVPFFSLRRQLISLVLFPASLSELRFCCRRFFVSLFLFFFSLSLFLFVFFSSSRYFRGRGLLTVAGFRLSFFAFPAVVFSSLLFRVSLEDGALPFLAGLFSDGLGFAVGATKGRSLENLKPKSPRIDSRISEGSNKRQQASRAGIVTTRGECFARAIDEGIDLALGFSCFGEDP